MRKRHKSRVGTGIDGAVGYGTKFTNWKASEAPKCPLYIEIVGQGHTNPGRLNLIRWRLIFLEWFRFSSFDTKECVKFTWIEQKEPGKRFTGHYTVVGSSCGTLFGGGGVKGPAGNATDAPQPWGLLYNPVMKVILFSVPSNGVPVELTGENRSTWRKTCPSATLSTTNPTWTDPRWNRGLRGESPATNRLSHGTASCATSCHPLWRLGFWDGC
jgi:hypothetical protein